MRLFLASLLAATLCAQTAPEVTIAKIRERMNYQLTHQPNYTCLETIERTVRPGVNAKVKPIDTLRMEVALVDGHEMFAWPGSRSFQDSDVTKMVSTGAIGSGDFGSHARSIFSGHNARFRYRGIVNFEGRDSIRVDYEVPQMVSGYKIVVGGASAIVGYHGSFYADPATFDVRRIEVVVEPMPPSLMLESASDLIEYAAVHIGSGDFLLPASSEMRMTTIKGLENINHITFSSCREFTGESVLTFDEPGAKTETSAAPRQVELGEGSEISLMLTADVDLRKAAIGDPVRARLTHDVKVKGEIVVPKGATVTGRIQHLQHRETVTVVGLVFEEMEAPGVVAHFHAALDHVSGLMPLHARISLPERLPGEGLFAVPALQFRLMKGCIMDWRSENQ